MTVVAGLVLALGSAFGLNWGWIAQHAAASSLPALSVRRPMWSLAALFRDARWVRGFGAGLAGWGLYIAALAVAPLSLVQATSAGGIGTLALLAHRSGARVTARERNGVVVSTAGLGLLALSLVGGATVGRHATPRAVIAWIVVSAIVAAAAVAGSRLFAPGAGLGLAAGALYAAGDVATKSLFAGGAWILLIAVVLAAHGAAFAVLQLGFQRGRALATAGTSSLLTNALPIGAGLVVFHEHLPGGIFSVLRVGAFVSVVVGAALLAHEAQTALDG
jgi:hypothetical protein